VCAALFYLLWTRGSRRETPGPVPANAENTLSADSSADERRNNENESEEKEKKGNGLDPAEWFYVVREYPHFNTGLKSYHAGMETALRQQTSYAGRGVWPGFAAPWTVQGPANIGARVNVVKAHPTDPNTILAGFSGGGLWKTTDGGTYWQPVFDTQSALAIGDIVFDPNNPNTVYVGTGDPNISGYPFIGNGLWKSTDGGNTWQYLGLRETRIISKIIVEPGNSNVLYVATMGLPFERTPDRGLYKTTDGGKTWKKILYISPEAGVVDLVQAPGQPQVLYAAVWDRIRNNRESLVAGNNARIWKTADGGATWVSLADSLPQEPKSRIALAIDAIDANHLLASYVNTSLDFDGIYETFDSGVSWKKNPASGLDPGFQGGFAWYFGKLCINPYNSLDIWILGVITYRSQDGGKTWAKVPDEQVHVDHHDVYFLSATSFLLATDGGLYRSSDNAATWTKIEQIPATQFYRVAYNPFQPAHYYGGAQDNGTVMGNTGSRENWERVAGGDGFQAVFHPVNSMIQYFEYQNGGILCSTDGGQTLLDGTQGIENGDRRSWDMPYFMSVHQPDEMYTGTYRVYTSKSHPAQWTPISPDLTDGIVFSPRFHVISTIDESPLDHHLLYVGTTDGNVWRGEADGQKWEKITDGLPDRYVSSVKASFNEPDRVFVAYTGYRDNDFTPRLYRSEDRGNTWKSISGDLPDLSINDIQVMPGHQDSLLFVATDGGVYGTLDGGKHWERLGRGMPVVPIYDLDIQPAQKTLIAGSHARSILSFPLDSLRIGADVSVLDIHALKVPSLVVYPTLASDHINLSLLNLNSRQTAQIVISNLAGQVVWRESVRAFQQQPVEIDVQSLPAGIYLAAAMVEGRRVGVKKFVVTHP
jgi:photosystem II stability/assembly factor-like uncharacterized protein